MIATTAEMVRQPNRLRWALWALLALALVSCGGGTSQVEPFKANRLITFGDELSAFTAEGRKYAVNGLNGSGQLDCNLMPLWTQVLAKVYGFGFAACPVDGGPTSAFSRAFAGAKAADVAAQVLAQLADGGIGEKDLATVLVGVNDVKELYQQSLPPRSRPEAELIAEAQTRGLAVARAVNDLVDRGARVIVVTAPDVGLSPFAQALGAAPAALMSRITAALNGRIRANILNDGRFVGLVLGDEFVQVASKGLYGFANVTTPACSVALPGCTTATLVGGASAETWLWADDTWLSTAGHRRLGTLAEARALGNPF